MLSMPQGSPQDNIKVNHREKKSLTISLGMNLHNRWQFTILYSLPKDAWYQLEGIICIETVM